MEHPVKRQRPGLHLYILPAYVLLIVYASLSPFTGWRPPSGGVLHFLGVWPRYITRFDVLINLFAYLPLGALGYLAARSPRRGRGAAVLVATGIGAAVSFSMETLQVFVPGRIASVLDLLTNAAGSLAGAMLAQSLGRRPHFARRLVRWRNHWFLPGRPADWGLMLLGLWLFGQINPSLPLMGVWSAQDPHPVAARFDMLLAASILLNTLALGLLLAALLHPGRAVWPAALAFLAACAVPKWLAAQALLKPAMLLQWLPAESLIGTGYAALLLAPALRAQAHTRLRLTAVCLGAGITLTVLNADSNLAVATLRLFDWRHGHLLNFNGLTRTLAEWWSLLALCYLLSYRKSAADPVDGPGNPANG